MIDNTVNAEYEVAQSSQLHLHPISCDVFEQTPVGDSISQVIFTSQSQNTFDTRSKQRKVNNLSNLCYEAMPFKQDSRALSEPPSSMRIMIQLHMITPYHHLCLVLSVTVGEEMSENK